MFINSFVLAQVTISKFDQDRYLDYGKMAENVAIVKDRYVYVIASCFPIPSLLGTCFAYSLHQHSLLVVVSFRH